MAKQVETQGTNQTTNETLDGLDDNQLRQFWNKEVGEAKQYFTDYWDTADQIVQRYRDERVGTSYYGRRTAEGGRLETKRFNILWSNIKTLFPALYTDPPDPVVGRRYKDDDPQANLAVEIIERCLQYVEDPAKEEHSYDAAMRNAVLDYLLVGRGVTWQRYERTIEQTETEEVTEVDAETGEEVVIAEARTEESVLEENIYHDHIQYRDFLHNTAPTWDVVLARGWVARRHYMTRAEIAEKFVDGEKIAPQVALTASDTSAYGGVVKSNDPNTGKSTRKTKAEVWEVWNVPNRKIYWYSEGYKDMLHDRDNPDGEDLLNLRDFFPCQRPLYATLTGDTLIPVPDFAQYYDQAENLDRITNQKWNLTTALRVAGLYAGKEGEKLQQLFDGSNRNNMIPIQDWMEGMKVEDLVAWVPLLPIAQALAELQKQELANKEQIYEITGIADIIRGQSKASETLGAQRLKGQWASVRLSDRQRLVGQFCRGALRIDAEIIAEHYDDKTILEMSNLGNSRWLEVYGPTIRASIALLRDDKMRNYRVDVETRDTVFADEIQERQQNVEMLTSMTSFMQTATELGTTNPNTIPVLGKMLKIGIKSFSGSSARQLETAVDEMIARTEQQAEMARQTPPQPSPEQIEAETKSQTEQGKLQIEVAKVQTERQGQVLDFQKSTRDQALERREQDLKFMGQERDRLAQLLARAAGG